MFTWTKDTMKEALEGRGMKWSVPEGEAEKITIADGEFLLIRETTDIKTDIKTRKRNISGSIECVISPLEKTVAFIHELGRVEIFDETRMDELDRIIEDVAYDDLGSFIDMFHRKGFSQNFNAQWKKIRSELTIEMESLTRNQAEKYAFRILERMLHLDYLQKNDFLIRIGEQGKEITREYLNSTWNEISKDQVYFTDFLVPLWFRYLAPNEPKEMNHGEQELFGNVSCEQKNIKRVFEPLQTEWVKETEEGVSKEIVVSNTILEKIIRFLRYKEWTEDSIDAQIIDSNASHEDNIRIAKLLQTRLESKRMNEAVKVLKANNYGEVSDTKDYVILKPFGGSILEDGIIVLHSKKN